MQNDNLKNNSPTDANNVLAARLPFDVEVEWTEQTNNPSPLGEVTFPFEQKKKGTLHFSEETLQHPFFFGQTLEKVVQICIEQNCLKKGVVDAVRIDSWKVV